MQKVNTLGTIEARMGSTRLPGKTLMKVKGSLTLLELVYQRFSLCREVDAVCVVTSTSPADNDIVELCRAKNMLCERGSENDVLDRVVGAASKYGPEILVQMGGDSAYLDFNLIDRLVRVYKKHQGRFDYVCNDLCRDYPLGIYGHIVKFQSLKEMNKKSNLTLQEREDVVRHFWNNSANYQLLNVRVNDFYKHPELRLTIDYEQDFELLLNLLGRLDNIDYTFGDILKIYTESADLFENVSKLVQKSLPPAGIQFQQDELGL
jgi:spore coat polysaccharide biosynthesis protein SpsF